MLPIMLASKSGVASRMATERQQADGYELCELCPQKWTFGHTKTDTYRFKEQFHRFETVMPETRYVDDVSH